MPDAVGLGARDSNADQVAEPLATSATRLTRLLGTNHDRAEAPDKQAVPVTPGGKASDGTRADAGALAGAEECEEAPDVSLEALGSVVTTTEASPGTVVHGSPAGTPAGPMSGTSPDRAAPGTGSGPDIPVERLEDPENSATERGTGRPGVAEKTLEQALPSVLADGPPKVLAELTRAPRRSRAVRRDGLRRMGIATGLVALLAVVFCAVQVLRPLPGPALVMTGAPSYTIAGAPLAPAWPGEGEAAAEVEGVGSLGTYGDQKPIPTGSMAKVMTAYVVLQDHPLKNGDDGPVIAVDAQTAKESTAPGESTAVVAEGQRFTERQMLQLMLIPSGNNIARLLSRWDAGSDAAFLGRMSGAARQLGMNDTTYTDPSGLDAGTRSTAVDQIRLARAAMQDPTFSAVVAMPRVTIAGVGQIDNNNTDLVDPGVIGIKTGSTSAAGGNLMWAAQQTVGGSKQLILGVVMAQHSAGASDYGLAKALAVSQKLISQVRKALTCTTVVHRGDVVGYLDDGLGGRAPVVAGADLTEIGWPGQSTQLTLSAPVTGLPHRAKAGTTVSTIALRTGQAAGTEVPVVLQHDMTTPGLSQRIAHLR
ncbi:D-alanyl-D-alanine carboxypeptidase family protein [Kitasatospora aureofaciens]|uniref:D-alanyl-D-alanine carboxypeptidase family protein n=1 Tax=Kitasatospora aureofaciens TaxID=1894 RepID=UPI0037C9914D